MIKTIIFDHGKVLGNDANEWDTTFANIKKETGLTSSEIDEIFMKYWSQVKRGQISIEIVFEEIAKNSRKKTTAAKIENLYSANHYIDEEMIGIVRKLKEKGFKLVILSNESKAAMDMKTRKFRLNELFDKIYCSAIMGVAKPSKEAYLHVLNDLGIRPEETLFIDNLERNITPAEELGIKCILFKSAEQFRKELKEINLL